MSPRPQIAHLRRPEILSAAAEVIRERGLGETRIADVAERIGASAPTVLYYFESKQELLSEALAFAEERYYEELAAELAGLGSARERLVRLVESCTEAGDYDQVLWMELWPRALRLPPLAATRDVLDRRWRRMIAAIVREGQEEGEFEGSDPDEVAASLACLLDGVSIQIALGDREVTPQRARAMCFAILEHTLGCALVEERGKRVAAAGSMS